ncbi:unnamed protein product [Euphydryas editha]|uniref:Peptidase S1 domain-containing protein n=1 Tax=Euphydryas editha TaxID=104508 RepID=A0AAU9UM79_EUPED|nr:unnamed protein product [Euphydryas editha]
MDLFRVSTIFAILLATTALRLPRYKRQDEISFDDQNEPKTCIAKNGKQGFCVDEKYCNADHVIETGGILLESEFREGITKKICNESLQWCCTLEAPIQSQMNSSENVDSCLAADGDICPWAVSLYKVTDLTKRTPKFPFCMGTLIGTRVILTAATCMKAAQNLMLYARVPDSAEPTRNYIVIDRKAHPAYNTGSHAYDFGLLVLEEEVNWGIKKSKGACLAFDKPTGTCTSLGFGAEDKTASTMLNVTSDVCNNFGGKAKEDRICTKNADTVCNVATGAPLVCESTTGKGVVVGVTRSSCNKDQVLVGSLSQSWDWITNELNDLHISKDAYLEK